MENPEDPVKTIANLLYIRKTYLNKNLENIIYTYPSLISRILFKLKIIGYVNLQQKKNDESSELQSTSNFKNLSVIINELYQYHQEYSSDLILTLYLNTAIVTDQLQLESLCYELFTQCFVIYEENLILSTHQNRNSASVNSRDSLSGGSLAFESILAIANSLAKTRNLSKDNYESLITKLTLYASRLLKKNEVTRAILACAHLWNQERKGEENDGKRVLECLQKCLRVADGCLDPFLSVKLFIEILNQSIILNVDSWFTNGVIELTKTNIENLEDNQELDILFKRVLAYMENPN